MSKLTELIEELCPDGVEYRPLGELGKRNKGMVITASRMKELHHEGGEVRIFAGGYTIADVDRNDLPGEAVIDVPSIIVKSRGNIGFEYHTRPFTHKNELWSYTLDDPDVDQKFIFYYLQSRVSYFQLKAKSGKLPQIGVRDTDQFSVPTPPLKVQREIVRVLDAFTDLEQSLVSELELRKKQYVEYRDTAIEDLVNGNVPSVHLGDHARTVNGLTGKNKSDFSDGNAKFITYRNVFSNPEVNLETNDYVKVAEGEKQNQVELGDVIFTGSSESREEVGFSAVVTQTPAEPIYLNSFCFVVRFEDPEFIDPGFAKHMFRGRPIRKQIMKSANGVTRINISKPRFMRVEIPVPPMEMQQEIAVKLDAFSSLIQSIDQEISLRRKQYEFYRDELLSFAPKED